MSNDTNMLVTATPVLQRAWADFQQTIDDEDYGLERESVERAFAAYIISFAKHAR